MITTRQRLLKILKGEKPDRLPWFADLSYWHYYSQINHILEKKYQGFEGLIRLHRDMGAGFYYPGYYPYIILSQDSQVTELQRNIGLDSDFYLGTAYADTIYKGIKGGVNRIRDAKNNDLVREIITPVGTIRERWAFAADSLSWSPEEYYIKSADDLDILGYYLKNSKYAPDFKNIDRVSEIVAEQGCVVCNLNKSPLMDMIHWYAGIMTTVNILADSKEKLAEVLEILEKKAEEALNIALKSKADILLIPDNLHSDLVGKNLFQTYLKQHYEKQTARISGTGKYSSVHMDGGLKGLLREVSLAGFSIIEALTPRPLGDLEIEEFEDYTEGDAVMWGGIPGVMFTPSTGDREFEEFVKRVIEKMVSRPKYVLGIADQVPPDGIIDRVSKVSELVEKYGRY